MTREKEKRKRNQSTTPPLETRRHDQTITTQTLPLPRDVKLSYFVAKLLLLSVLMFGCVIGITNLNHLPKVLCVIGMGLLIAHATELVHQCLHRIASGRAPFDNVLGRLLGLPSGTSFWYYRWFHLWHHRFNGTEQDKESFGYTYQLMEAPSRLKRTWGFCRHLSMIGHYRTTLSRMWLAITGRLGRKLCQDTPEMNPSAAQKIQRDYQIMVVVLVSAIVLSLFFHTYILIELWLLPLLIVWGPVHALIELPEHWGCDRPSSDPFRNTRSIKASRLARWFTNNNCNHVGHHYDMSVPMENLPAFEDALSSQHPFKFHDVSYGSFYLGFFGKLWSPSAQKSSE
jgi:fatty acid desaturase